MSKKENGNQRKQSLQLILVIVISLAAVGGFALFTGAFSGTQKETEPAVVKDDTSEQEKDAPEPDECVGQWECTKDHTFTVDIWQDETGVCHAVVNRREGADEVSFWEMSGRASDGSFRYTDAKKSLTTYDKKGNESSTDEYEDGKGSFSVKGKYLHWDDEEENAGKKKEFKQVGEY